MTTSVMIGLLSFGWLAVFQIALATGLPLGHLAWGGAVRVLPTPLRIASAGSALLALLAWGAVAQSGAIIGPVLPEVWLRPIFWGLVVIFGLSVLANLFGARGAERVHGVPLAGLCAGSSLALALG